ncbi:hypothetical protein BDV11DRAFT_185461 [Aspergillus similis]
MVELLYHGLQRMDTRKLSSYFLIQERWMCSPRTLTMVELLYPGLRREGMRELSSYFLILERWM